MSVTKDTSFWGGGEPRQRKSLPMSYSDTCRSVIIKHSDYLGGKARILPLRGVQLWGTSNA